MYIILYKRKSEFNDNYCLLMIEKIIIIEKILIFVMNRALYLLNHNFLFASEVRLPVPARLRPHPQDRRAPREPLRPASPDPPAS